MGIQFRHSGGEKVAEFSNKTDESIKLATGGCIIFTVILLILFLADIFDVVFVLFFKCKNYNQSYRFFKKDFR